MKKQSIADVLKPLAKVTHTIGGKYLSHGHAEDCKLRDAIALVKGTAVLTKPPVRQAAMLAGVPVPALHYALTSRGLRKPRKSKLASSAPAGWKDNLDAIAAEVGDDAIVDHLAVREAPRPAGNGATHATGNGADTGIVDNVT